MSSVVISGDTSGTVTVTVPAVAGTNTVTIAAQTGTLNAAGPAFSAYLSANQTVSAGANTKIQFNTEEFDTNSNYDNSTNYRFTPTVAGYYQITVSAGNTNGSTYQQCMIYKNGSQFKASNLTNSTTSSLVTSLVYMNGSTDYVEGWTYTGATGVSGSSITTYFQGCLVRGA